MKLRKLEDIELSEFNLKTRYYNYFLNGKINEAQQLVKDNPSLQFKVVNADNLNTLIDYILKEENLYYNEVVNYLIAKENEYQIELNELLYLDEYKGNTEYNINNFVLYKDNIYFCIKDCINILPDNTEYWLCLGLLGKPSYESIGVNYAGIWNNGINYKKNDMVAYQNSLYVAKKDNFNSAPSNNSDWFIGVQIINKSIIVSETEPLQLGTGSIWIKIKGAFT